MPIWMQVILLIFLIFMIMALLQIYRKNQQYQQQIFQLKLDYEKRLNQEKKRSTNTSRAVLKGKMAEQLAPILPEFQYWPSDAKFLGDPIDYVIFDGYNAYREGIGRAEDIYIVFVDIKSGQARLTKGQLAIAEAIRAGRIRFETVRINFDET